MTATTDRPGRTDLPSRTATRVGWGLSAVTVLFLLFDAGIKLARLPVAVDGTLALGFPESSVRLMGVLLLAGVLLHVVPRTSVFGAVFITAYLGGAVAANIRVDAPLFGNVLFPVYVAVLLWLGSYLRSAALRALVRTEH